MWKLVVRLAGSYASVNVGRVHSHEIRRQSRVRGDVQFPEDLLARRVVQSPADQNKTIIVIASPSVTDYSLGSWGSSLGR
jgi:hypothetical protein